MCALYEGHGLRFLRGCQLGVTAHVWPVYRLDVIAATVAQSVLTAVFFFFFSPGAVAPLKKKRGMWQCWSLV